MNPMNGIQRRLLLLLGALIVVVSGLQFAASFSAAMAQTNRLFDAQMRQITRTLRLSPGAVSGADKDFHAQFDLVIQLWRADQVTVYQERQHRMLPPRAPLGYSDITLANGEWRVYAAELDGGVVQVAQKLAARRTEAINLALNTLWPMLLMSLLLLGAMRWIVIVALRPLGAVRDQIARRDARALEPVDSRDAPPEIVPLLDALNGLLARVSDNIELQRQFVADAAHELRSPLTVLRMQIQMLGKDQPETDRQASLAVLAAAIARSSRMVEQLLGLARQDALGQDSAAPERIELSDFAGAAIAELAGFAASKQVELSFLDSMQVAVPGHADSLMILMRNLLDNAVRYTPAGGAVSIAVGRHGGCGVLTIADSGPGIPEADLPRVTGRFYRVPGSSDSGSGLGLAIVLAAARHLGARLELRNSVSGGLVASVVFPQVLP